MIRSAGSLPAGAAAARAAARTVPRAGSPRTGRLAAGAPWLVLFLALAAAPLLAQSIAVTPAGTIVAAHDGVVDLYAADAKTRIWRAAGVPYSGAIAAGEKDIAVLDPIDNRAVVIDLESGIPRPIRTGETPIAAAFVGRDLYVLDRDARIVERIAATGPRARVAVAADPAFMREDHGTLYVYSRTAGSLQEITLTPFAVSRSKPVAPFASDLEISRHVAYLVYPTGSGVVLDASRFAKGGGVRKSSRSAGTIRTVDLTSMQAMSEVPVGAVPVDLALIVPPTPISAVMVAVADPSSRRVWMLEGEQSVAEATARGFLRGLIGLSANPASASIFESGVDRLSMNGSSSIAYDSSIGTLYRFSKGKSSVVAHGVAPNAFSAIPGGVAWWQDGTLVAQTDNR